MAVNTMTKLTLGPIAYHWSADARRDFYARIADEAPVDEVYLGEVICSKRAPFHEADLPATIERLERAGKTVILSTLAEVMLKRERKATEDLAAMDTPEIEVNNAAGLYARGKRPHRIGPFMNAYNDATIAWMAGQGATHVCLPAEMPAPAIAAAAQAAVALGLGVEVQVYGRASLAVSARCYHARAHGRTKDNCQFVCEEDPDGMPLRTRDDRPILRVRHPDPVGKLCRPAPRSGPSDCRWRHAPAADATGGGHGRGGAGVPRCARWARADRRG